MANTTASMPAMGAAASSSEASGGSWFTGEVSLDSYRRVGIVMAASIVRV